jgi:hypothetical protein
MAFSDLTPEQQEDIKEFFRDFRPAIADFVRACRTFESLVTIYNQNVLPVWSTVVNADVIDDDNGLADSGTMTKADWTPIIAWADSVQSDLYDAGGVSSVNWPDANTLDSYGVLAAGPTNI